MLFREATDAPEMDNRRVESSRVLEIRRQVHDNYQDPGLSSASLIEPSLQGRHIFVGILIDPL